MLSQNSRLPLTHPDYLYPSSLNPYWKKIYDTPAGVYMDNQAESLAGQWRQQLGVNPTSSLSVEIGCNGGHWLLGQASAEANNPNCAHLGIDWKFKQIFLGHQKAKKKDLSKIGFIRAHAERLHFLFKPQEISRLYLLFPDPWPKKAHLKNRLFQSQWLSQIHPLFSTDGIFEIRTDHAGYFEFMLEQVHLSRDLYCLKEHSWNHYQNHPNPMALQIPEVTLFERLFIQEGKPIHSLKIAPIQRTQ